MTPQEIVDNVAVRLRDGRGQASDRIRKTCRYRSIRDIPCAVGCLLDDETARMWDTLNLPLAKLVSLPDSPKWMAANLSLLMDLQTLHDGANWEEKKFANERSFEFICDKYDLEYPQ